MGIKVVGIADTNVDPEKIDYPIPGNDDALRAIELYTTTVADIILEAKGNMQPMMQEEETEFVELPGEDI